jgi:hypothetical protein|tara:strand:+ start:333 stop:575 length:243 start_codon:yes stop_codon:yes gene_type:complete
MNIEDKALDIILDHTSSSEWEDVCELTWNTDEVQELLIKALNQGRLLPIDSVMVCSNCKTSDMLTLNNATCIRCGTVQKQ